jgi:hypothetical protein
MSTTTVFRPKHSCRPPSMMEPVIGLVVECDHCKAWWRWTAPGIGYRVPGHWKRMGRIARARHHIARRFDRT